MQVPENFVLISGGSFVMGSPESENWRSADETQHTVSVSDFYMGRYEVTQAKYQDVTGQNPSSFSGETLPVENLSWLDAVRYCNARSEREVPTEAEWEYACRAGTVIPFSLTAFSQNNIPV